jgi:hypothetical protein
MTAKKSTKQARQLRIEALRIHKELLDKFSIEETREIIRQLTTIEAVLSRQDDEAPLREVDEA